MLAPPFQLLSLNNRLVADLTKTAQNSVNSFTTTEKNRAPQFSQTESVQNRTAQPIEEVRVAMAEVKFEDMSVTLVTNVGSCVAVCIYDAMNKCGGLAHIMLPNSSVSRNKHFPLKFNFLYKKAHSQ